MMDDSDEEEPQLPSANIVDLALNQCLYRKECWQNGITSIHQKFAEYSNIGNYWGFVDSEIRSHPNRTISGHNFRMCRINGNFKK